MIYTLRVKARPGRAYAPPTWRIECERSQLLDRIEAIERDEQVDVVRVLDERGMAVMVLR